MLDSRNSGSDIEVQITHNLRINLKIVIYQIMIRRVTPLMISMMKYHFKMYLTFQGLL